MTMAEMSRSTALMTRPAEVALENPATPDVRRNDVRRGVPVPPSWTAR
jgi:hypothetical protein